MSQYVNNLFEFATSELSQDAIICWLTNWSDDKFTGDEPMHTIGRRFLETLFACWNKNEQPQAALPASISIKIVRQANNTDINIFLNESVIICIEDKTKTSHHSNQLERCVKSVQENPEYAAMQKLFIYFKTDDFIPDQNLNNSAFAIYDRDRLVSFLGSIDIESNAILYDYAQYILKLDSAAQSFEITPIEEWSPEAISRFHSKIGKLAGLEGDKVSNPRGGFYGCWGKEVYIPDEMCAYLQIQTELSKPVKSKLFFRISELANPENVNEIRQKWYNSLTEAADKHHVKIEKVNWRDGQTMSIAAMTGDFRVCNANGIIDMGSTKKNLEMAENVLKDAKTIYSSK